MLPSNEQPIDGQGNAIEYATCLHCRRDYWARLGASNTSCGKLSCDLARDRKERENLLGWNEGAYREASRQYHQQQDDARNVAAGRAPGAKAGGLKPIGAK